MSEKLKFYISHANLPPRLPVMATATVYLLIDRFGPPDWVIGAIAVLGVMYWLTVIWMLTTYKSVDVMIALGSVSAKVSDTAFVARVTGGPKTGV